MIEAKQIPVIRDFIANELARQKHCLEMEEDDRKKDWNALDRCFLEALHKG